MVVLESQKVCELRKGKSFPDALAISLSVKSKSDVSKTYVSSIVESQNNIDSSF